MRQHLPNAAMAAMAWSNLAGLWRELGRTDEASMIAREGLAFMRRSGSVLAHADTLACLLAQRGQPVPAARLLGASDAHVKRSGEARGENEERAVCSARSLLLDALGAGDFAANVSVGASLEEDAVAGLVATALDSHATGDGVLRTG
jgi:hypothetical protein